MKQALTKEIRRHLQNGRLPEDYVLPEQPAVSAEPLPAEQLDRRVKQIVRAVHRNEYLRIRFNAAVRKMTRLAHLVPCETGAEALKAAFQARGKRLNPVQFGEFLAQCFAESRDAEALKWALVLVPLLEPPRPFRFQPVPVWRWNRIIQDVKTLSFCEAFAPYIPAAAEHLTAQPEESRFYAEKEAPLR